jgi:hypothetical protein
MTTHPCLASQKASPGAQIANVLPAHLNPANNGSKQAGLEPSLTMLSLFVGLDKPASQLDLPKHNVWLFPSWQHDENVRIFREVGAGA